jgi:hypothetical protein
VAQVIVLDLSISRQELARYYAGHAQAVLARARDGRRVRFPVRVLRSSVTHAGVHGTFALTVDGNRLVRFERIPSPAGAR